MLDRILFVVVLYLVVGFAIAFCTAERVLRKFHAPSQLLDLRESAILILTAPLVYGVLLPGLVLAFALRFALSFGDQERAKERLAKAVAAQLEAARKRGLN